MMLISIKTYKAAHHHHYHATHPPTKIDLNSSPHPPTQTDLNSSPPSLTPQPLLFSFIQYIM